MNVLGKWNRLSIRRKSIIWLSTLVAARIIRQSGQPCVILFLTAFIGWDRSGRILSPTSGNTTPKSFPCRMWPGP